MGTDVPLSEKRRRWDKFCAFLDANTWAGQIGQCSICYGRMFDPVHSVSKVLRESYSVPGCDHNYCRGCLSSWISSKVHDGHRVIPCPMEGCRQSMSISDVRRIAPADTAK